MLFGPKEEPVGWNQIADDVKTLTDQEPNYSADFERILCSDESCIGLVGKDGHCRVCGLAYEGDMEITEEPEEDGTELAVSSGESAEEYEEASGDESEDDHDEDYDDFDDRILCSDESCIGLVGEDGYCKYCGLLYKEEGYAEDEEWVYREDDEDEPADGALAEEDSSGEETAVEDSAGEYSSEDEPEGEEPSDSSDKETR